MKAGKSNCIAKKKAPTTLDEACFLIHSIIESQSMNEDFHL